MSRQSLAWHESAASKNYEPSVYKEFKYDNLNNKIFNLIEKIEQCTRNIQDDSSDVIKAINRISNYYGSVGDYDEYLKNMKELLTYRVNDLASTNKVIMKTMNNSISHLQSNDSKLINDIEWLNHMIKRG